MRVSLRFLYVTVFTSGMVVLAIELAASRLLGSVFGTSNLVWASIIGLILIYLTAGYFLGGWWADHSPTPQTMYTILAWGAFTAGLVPLVAQPVLRWAANAFDQLQVGILVGSFAAVIILLSIPVTLLGTISPFAIRLAITDQQTAGRVSGKIYAISTLGSFIGTFLPVLVTIPVIGTSLTFVSFSGLLLLVALSGLWISMGWRKTIRWVWMLAILVVAAIWLAGRPIKASTGQIYETESAYNYIQVQEIDGYRMLRLNEGQGVHSMWHPSELDYAGPWEQFLAAPFFNAPPYYLWRVRSMAIVGLAAGTLARQATAVYGPLPIDGFEIDPKVIEVGRMYFGMTLANLNTIVQDGRWGLENSRKQYTLIALDAYCPPYIPWHLTTLEFFQVVYNHLTEDGVVAVNVGRAPDDRRLIDGLFQTIRSIFPSVYVMDVPDSFNSILYATRQETQIENLYQNYLELLAQPDTHPLLITSLNRLIVYQQPAPSTGAVFTDDRASIEWITNRMVLNYVFFGDMEKLK